MLCKTHSNLKNTSTAQHTTKHPASPTDSASLLLLLLSPPHAPAPAAPHAAAAAPAAAHCCCVWCFTAWVLDGLVHRQDETRRLCRTLHTVHTQHTQRKGVLAKQWTQFNLSCTHRLVACNAATTNHSSLSPATPAAHAHKALQRQCYKQGPGSACMCWSWSDFCSLLPSHRPAPLSLPHPPPYLYCVELDQCWLPHKGVKGVDHTPSVDINTKVLQSSTSTRSRVRTSNSSSR